MSPVSQTVTELQMVVARAVMRVGELHLRCPAFAEAPQPQLTLAQAELHDHRIAVAGDLADALDRIQPGLGTQWMRALHPEVPAQWFDDEPKCAGAGAFDGVPTDARTELAANASAPAHLQHPTPTSKGQQL